MLRGAGTKQQPLFDENRPLNVGEPSTAYSSTLSTVNGINTMIDFIVDVVAYIETVPPTGRTTNTRVWGPWPDSQHPGFEVRVTITKKDVSHFSYVFEWRPTNGDFFTIISGDATATANLHRGQGSIHLAFELAFEKFGGTAPTADSATIGYDTSMFPTAVEVQANALNDAGTAEIDYGQAADTSGHLTFTIDPPVAIEDGGVVELVANTFWLADGSGRQDGLVSKGSWTGVNGIECWDSSQAVTYQKWWDGTEHGDAGSCPANPFTP